ncbi:MAG: SGNH/GDSL hydrolase family protein [Candidatus Micrarchaeia archaeon]
MDRLLAIALMLSLLAAGCLSFPKSGTAVREPPPTPPERPPNPTPANSTGTAEPDAGPATAGNASAPPGAEKSGGSVLILGRSVARGWIDYMGGEYTCFDEGCGNAAYVANYSGRTFIYSELDPPPDIVGSAADRLERFGDRADTVFFKLCFVDFESDPSGENLRRDEGYIQAAYDEIVVKRHKKMIVGNALPSVASSTDQTLVSSHREYNRWLDGFAKSHKDIKVLDLYGMLSDSSGSLDPRYASSPDDSHPNAAGYSRITPGFLALLG